MSSPLALWLPILVSAVVVFVLSSIFHMVLPWHTNDFPRLPDEDAVMDALRPLAIPPGEYLAPRPTSRDTMRSPEFTERVNRGPVFILRMMPNRAMDMVGSMIQWFVYLLIVVIFAAMVAWPAAHDRSGHMVFHTVGLSSFMGYGFALAQMSIWYRRSWVLTGKGIIDAFIYAIVTGLIFMWLWPM
jgi:hypothetical protein